MSFPQQFVTSMSNSRSRASSSSSITNQNSGYTGQRRGKLDLYEPEPASSHVMTTSLEVVSESEVKRKREKLFKAVIDGDIQLVSTRAVLSVCNFKNLFLTFVQIVSTDVY